jgi:DNA-binding response OmpR family regulator
MRLLVVEDEVSLRQALLRLLDRWGYAAEGAGDAPAALSACAGAPYDLVLLDLGLPGGDGMEVCRELRGRSGHQPMILILTARDSSADKVVGLDCGADDYVVKPFDPMVLQARIRALLRRSQRPISQELVWGPVRMHPGEVTVSIDECSLTLTRKEALLIETLLRAQGAACTKAELLSASGGGRREVGEETIKAHMRNLRSKLTLAGAPPDLIETIYGLGYRLHAGAQS